jgi:hypothetical protein
MHLTGLISSKRECGLESGNGHSFATDLQKHQLKVGDFENDSDQIQRLHCREMAKANGQTDQGLVWNRWCAAGGKATTRKAPHVFFA